MAFPAAKGMSDRIHRIAAHMGSATHMSLPPGLTDTYVLVIGVTEPAECRPAFLAKHPHFATRQNDGDPITLFCHDSRSVSGAPYELSALSGRHLYIMNLQSGGYRFQRHRITNLGLTTGTASYPAPHSYTLRSQYVPFFTVGVVQQGYKAISVRVVLNCCHLCGDAIFVTLEVNNTVNSSCPAASEPGSSDAVMVSAAALLYPLAKRLLRL
jgi:hypothetical protein